MVDCPEQLKYEAGEESANESKVSLKEATGECFSEGPTMLSKISMDVKEGQILAVIGPWRSGKVS